MAIAIVHTYPGGTKEQYEATVEAVHPPGGLPAGQTHHFAGPSEDGWQVFAVWDSQESLDAFMSETLMPALEELGERGFPGPPEQTVYEVDTALFA
jgi:hypothetical protein